MYGENSAYLMAAAPDMYEAIKEVLKEIEYCHGDMLTKEERNHPRGSGWARVYYKLTAAIGKAEGKKLTNDNI